MCSMSWRGPWLRGLTPSPKPPVAAVLGVRDVSVARKAPAKKPKRMFMVVLVEGSAVLPDHAARRSTRTRSRPSRPGKAKSGT